MLQGKIRRGELDRPIIFIEEVTSRGTSNQDKNDSWREVTENAAVFARRRERRGNEVVIGDQLKFIQATEFVVVYRTDLSVKNRIVFNGKVYEIISITETEQRMMYLEIITNFLDNEPVPSTLGEFNAEAFSTAFNVG